MKVLILRLALAITAAILISSCQKETKPVKIVTRSINFNLYTEKDFSTQNDSISFNIIIRDGSTKVLDSTVARMKIKDIPNKANKLVFPKTFKAGDVDLRIGFTYTIKNVGYSWYFEDFAGTDMHKELNFSFK